MGGWEERVHGIDVDGTAVGSIGAFRQGGLLMTGILFMVIIGQHLYILLEMIYETNQNY